MRRDGREKPSWPRRPSSSLCSRGRSRSHRRWIALFLATALLLPPLPIPIGDSGPHPSLLFAAIGLFAGLLHAREWRWTGQSPAPQFVALFGVLLASVGAAAVYSGDAAAAGSLARVLLFAIPVYLYLYCSCGPGREPVSLRPLYWAAVIAALFACVDFYYQFPAPAGYGPQFVWLDSGVYRRAQGLFYEASTLGNFCAFFLVMIAVAFSRPRAQSPVSRAALAAGAAVFMAALVLSYSRASLITVAIALAVLVWRNRTRVPLAKVAVLGSAARAGHVVDLPPLRPGVVAAHLGIRRVLLHRHRRRALRPRRELAHAGGVDRVASLADAVRHRLQDAAVHRAMWERRSSPTTCT